MKTKELEKVRRKIAVSHFVDDIVLGLFITYIVTMILVLFMS